MTGRSRFTQAELERMDRDAEKAAKLSSEEIARLLQKYRQQPGERAREIVMALSAALAGR